MAEENVLPMREEFSRWYRTVDVGENRSRLDARWTGVSSLVRAADAKSVETMLAVLLGTKWRPDAESMTSLRNHFKIADDLFEMSGNDRELEILCGVALATVLEGAGDAAAHAALATTVAFFARGAQWPIFRWILPRRQKLRSPGYRTSGEVRATNVSTVDRDWAHWIGSGNARQAFEGGAHGREHRRCIRRHGQFRKCRD